ncbi:MAG: hypothetical protein H6622_08545 [Halobacteriovoraceae bacterium]|nr:hypothetical protein [Halobacteriovoraceae bacterium]
MNLRDEFEFVIKLLQLSISAGIAFKNAMERISEHKKYLKTFKNFNIPKISSSNYDEVREICLKYFEQFSFREAEILKLIFLNIELYGAYSDESINGILNTHNFMFSISSEQEKQKVAFLINFEAGILSGMDNKLFLSNIEKHSPDLFSNVQSIENLHEHSIQIYERSNDLFFLKFAIGLKVLYEIGGNLFDFCQWFIKTGQYKDNTGNSNI